MKFHAQIEEVERRILTNALIASKGNKRAAATSLGLARTSFLEKLRRLDIVYDPTMVAKPAVVTPTPEPTRPQPIATFVTFRSGYVLGTLDEVKEKMPGNELAQMVLEGRLRLRAVY